MSKSIIYVGNAVTQATAVAGTVVSFPNIVRKYGCNLSLNGGNVVADGAGYYEGTVNLTIAGTADGNAIVQVYDNGVAVPYAYANVATTATSETSVSVPFVIRNNCNCLPSTLTVEVSGVVTSIINAAMVVEKE